MKQIQELIVCNEWINNSNSEWKSSLIVGIWENKFIYFKCLNKPYAWIKELTRFAYKLSDWRLKLTRMIKMETNSSANLRNFAAFV